ncbi:MAG: NAD(P)-dependent oxidoreductase [Deltaproteobacteria bacterium]|nr:NAD(P)-dependent oxidoreductase [Deltaproteobacteria bacterium]
MKLAFLGLGRMGQGMAARLAGIGHDLTVYNRGVEKTVPLEKLGAKVAQTPADAVAGAEIVFTILANDEALQSVMDEAVLTAMAPGGVHVSMSTVSTRLAATLAKTHKAAGRVYLACPVFGRPDVAAAGALRLCLAGPAAGRETVKPLLARFGEVTDFGDDPVAAHAVKLAGNFMIATVIETLGEAFTLLEKNNASPETFYDLISNAMFACPMVRNYGRILLDGEFDTAGFTAELGAKDVRLIRDAARMSETPMPLAAVLEERFTRILARGWDAKDWTVVARCQREDAGLA